MGIPFTERPDTDSTPIDYVSESGVSIIFKVAGEVNPALPNIPQAKAGVGVEFSQEGAFILKAPASYEPSIESTLDLEKHLLKALKKGDWDREWTVIVRLVQTPVATILVSNSSQSKLELAVEGDISPADINLGNGAIKFGFRAQKGDVLQFVGAENLTPIFQLGRLKRRLFGSSFRIRALRMRTSTIEAPASLPSGEEALYFDLVSGSDTQD